MAAVLSSFFRAFIQSKPSSVEPRAFPKCVQLDIYSHPTQTTIHVWHSQVQAAIRPGEATTSLRHDGRRKKSEHVYACALFAHIEQH